MAGVGGPVTGYPQTLMSRGDIDGTELGEIRAVPSTLQTKSGSENEQSSVVQCLGAPRDLVETDPGKHGCLNLSQNPRSQGLDLCVTLQPGDLCRLEAQMTWDRQGGGVTLFKVRGATRTVECCPSGRQLAHQSRLW